MSAGMNLSQVHNLGQQLNLAPQLLQWLRILQVPTVELSAIVQRELETNPALEVDERSPESASPAEVSVSDPWDGEGAGESGASALETEPTTFEDSDRSRKLELLSEIDNEWREDYHDNRASGRSDEELQARHQFVMDTITAPHSLEDHLRHQLSSTRLSPVQREVAEFIIGSLDRRGYLSMSIEEVADLAGVTPQVAEEGLRMVQALDPAGVGARDLRECIMLQLEGRKGEGPLALAIVRDCFDLLTERRFGDIAAQMKVLEGDVMQSVAMIRKMDPEPGCSVACEPVQYITADVMVYKVDGQYITDLNDEHIPHLRINSGCQKLVDEKQGVNTSDLSYIRHKMRHANFLIQGIAQRQDTLRKVAREIVRVQQTYFDSKDGELSPLTMGRVARMIGVHETTVSRAISGKYMKTPRGLNEMKFFFKAGYACADGSALTPEQVKQAIQSLVDKESPVSPLTDLQLVRLLQKRGIKVARRTIAKYREELCIDSSKDRVMVSSRKVAAKRVESAKPVTPLVEAEAESALKCAV